MPTQNLRVNALGEWGLIARIRAAVARGARLPVDIGDDAFVGNIAGTSSLVVTTDLLVEGTHFRRDWATPRQIGRKSLAVNLSDLAAMGACRPRFCVVGLALPGTTPVSFVKELYTGMQDMARKWQVRIAGGDTVKNDKNIVISITIMGEIQKGRAITRAGAQVGDYVAVTGPFGDAAGGLYLLQNRVKTGRADRRYLLKRHLLPEPRLDASRRLAGTGRITSMIDSSDGLALSLRFIGEESRVGARIDLDRVPVSPHLRRLCQGGEPKLLPLVLQGGEEYELVFTFPPAAAPVIQKAYPGAAIIGVITRERKITYHVNNKPYPLPAPVFQHFA